MPIPWDILNDEPTMKTIRGLARFNPDMPGSIEQVHPNKFLPSKHTTSEAIVIGRLETSGRVQTHPSDSH